MERNRKQKLLMIIALVVGIASLSVGFAAFSTTLNISSSASVSPNSDTFSVKFSTSQNSLVVGEITPSSKTGGVTTTNGVIDNSTNPTIKNLSASFTNPGQYVEYTFYARNEGEYTAYLNNINFVGNKTCKSDGDATDSLVQSACESINITAVIASTTYTETTPITGHTLNKKTGEKIKVRLEYASNGAYVDGSFTIKFPDIALVYSTLDDSTIQPTLPIARLVSGDLDSIGSEICLKEECFYVISSTEDTVTMLAKYNLHVGYMFADLESYNLTLSQNIPNPTGIQDSNSSGPFSNIFPVIGTTEFSNDGAGYEGSIIKTYIDDYDSYLTNFGIDLLETRLISYNELCELGCSNGSCLSAPEWVYSTAYWSGTTEMFWAIGLGAYSISRNGDFELDEVECVHLSGVRPVITISKSDI